MGTSSKELARKLRKLAKRQHGCFTAAQAIETGYADSVHLYHVKNGEWIRVFRGVYRFADAAETPAARCRAALLWTRDKTGKIQGVLASDTLSALHSGGLAQDHQIQIVVPKVFRRSSDIPEGIQITILNKYRHKTLNNCVLHVQKTDLKSPKSIPDAPMDLDAPDYYDWIDYQAVLCPQNS
jgi:hypothetical protein